MHHPAHLKPWEWSGAQLLWRAPPFSFSARSVMATKAPSPVFPANCSMMVRSRSLVRRRSSACRSACWIRASFFLQQSALHLHLMHQLLYAVANKFGRGFIQFLVGAER